MANRKRNRNRYREMESIMMKVLIADGLLFFLYMFAASRVGFWPVVKWISAAVVGIVSLLSLGWLYLTRELTRRRSLWITTACIAILACLLVSVCLGYPCPPVVPALTE